MVNYSYIAFACLLAIVAGSLVLMHIGLYVICFITPKE